jgi:hypothetical protein
MPLVGCERVADRCLFTWRGLLVAFAIVGLTVSLAARGFQVRVDVRPTVHSSAYDKVQHRDKDAIEWASPVANLCLLWITESSRTAEVARKIYFRVQYDTLYNRPPPAALAFAMTA